MFSQEVTTKNGAVKNVVAQSQEELDEAVKAVKAEQSAVAPDINNPKDGNKIVSPDNKHTEDVPSQVDNNVEEVSTEEPKKEAKPKEAPAKEEKPEAKKSEEPAVTHKAAPQEFTKAVPATKDHAEIPPQEIKK